MEFLSNQDDNPNNDVVKDQDVNPDDIVKKQLDNFNSILHYFNNDNKKTEIKNIIDNIIKSIVDINFLNDKKKKNILNKNQNGEYYKEIKNILSEYIDVCTKFIKSNESEQYTADNILIKYFEHIDKLKLIDNKFDETRNVFIRMYNLINKYSTNKNTEPLEYTPEILYENFIISSVRIIYYLSVYDNGIDNNIQNIKDIKDLYKIVSSDLNLYPYYNKNEYNHDVATSVQKNEIVDSGDVTNNIIDSCVNSVKLLKETGYLLKYKADMIKAITFLKNKNVFSEPDNILPQLELNFNFEKKNDSSSFPESGVITNKSVLFFIRCDNYDNYRIFMKEPEFLIDCDDKPVSSYNNVIRVDDINNILKSNPESIRYTNTLSGIDEIVGVGNVYKKYVYIIHIYDVETKIFDDKFIVCGDEIITKIKTGVNNYNIRVITKDEKNAIPAIENEYMVKTQEQLKDVELFLCKINEYNKRLIENEINKTDENRISNSYIPRKYENFMKSNISDNINKNISLYTDLLFNPQTYSYLSVEDTYKYTTNSNNAILLLFVNVLNRLKHHSGSSSDINKNIIATQFSCNERYIDLKTVENSKNRIFFYSLDTNINDCYLSDEYSLDGFSFFRNPEVVNGNKLSGLIDNITSEILTNMNDIKILELDCFNIKLFKNLSCNLNIHSEEITEKTDFEKSTEFKNTFEETAFNLYNLTINFVNTVSEKIIHYSKSNHYYYSKNIEIKYEKGDKVYIHNNNDEWLKATIVDVKYGLDIKNSKDVDSSDDDDANKSNTDITGGAKIFINPSYSQFVSFDIDDKTKSFFYINKEKEISINPDTDYIRVYGNVLPLSFLFEIDGDDKKKTFDYGYKSSYSNEVVKSRITSIITSVEKYVNIITEIKKNISSKYLKIDKKDSIKDKMVYNSICFFNLYLLRIRLFLANLEINTRVAISNVDDIKIYYSKSELDTDETDDDYQTWGNTEDKTITNMSIYLKDYSPFSQNLEDKDIADILNINSVRTPAISTGGKNKSVKNTQNLKYTSKNGSIKNKFSRYVKWN